MISRNANLHFMFLLYIFRKLENTLANQSRQEMDELGKLSILSRCGQCPEL